MMHIRSFVFKKEKKIRQLKTQLKEMEAMDIVTRSFEFEQQRKLDTIPRQILPSIAFVLSIFRLLLIALHFHEILSPDRYRAPLKFQPETPTGNVSLVISILVEFIQFPRPFYCPILKLHNGRQ